MHRPLIYQIKRAAGTPPPCFENRPSRRRGAIFGFEISIFRTTTGGATTARLRIFYLAFVSRKPPLAGRVRVVRKRKSSILLIVHHSATHHVPRGVLYFGRLAIRSAKRVARFLATYLGRTASFGGVRLIARIDKKQFVCVYGGGERGTRAHGVVRGVFNATFSKRTIGADKLKMYAAF